MKLALRELRRQPGRFAAAGMILTLIALLLMFLGGLLDGLIRSSTGAVRALDADVLVFSSSAENAFLRSRVEPALRATVDAVDGVEQTAGIGVLQFGARMPDSDPRDLLDIALFGTELPLQSVDALPGEGEVLADESLRQRGVTEGMVLELGPGRSPVTVVGFTKDTSDLGQAALWASPQTWREVLGENRPDQLLGPDVFQALLVRLAPGSDAAAVAERIDEATGAATASLTVIAAADTLPGVQEQQATFNQIIGVTVAIAIVVVALFFALLTIERAGLYGVLKAIGAESRSLFGGLVLQAVVLTTLSCGIAAVAAVGLDLAIPPGSIPLRISALRLITSLVYLLVAAVVGCAFSLRRVLRVDPASAIGSSS